LHTSKLADGTSSTPRETGLTVCRNQIFVARLSGNQPPASLSEFPPLVLIVDPETEFIDWEEAVSGGHSERVYLGFPPLNTFARKVA
jgi:hypothetical protein